MPEEKLQNRVGNLKVTLVTCRNVFHLPAPLQTVGIGRRFLPDADDENNSVAFG